MIKKRYLAQFASIGLMFIVAQIYKHTQFVQQTYRKQQCEHMLAESDTKKASLVQELCALKDRERIRQFAYKELHMKPISLTQIKRLAL